jgi:mannan endo-1,4-beta-mannosidase
LNLFCIRRHIEAGIDFTVIRVARIVGCKAIFFMKSTPNKTETKNHSNFYEMIGYLCRHKKTREQFKNQHILDTIKKTSLIPEPMKKSIIPYLPVVGCMLLVLFFHTLLAACKKADSQTTTTDTTAGISPVAPPVTDSIIPKTTDTLGNGVNLQPSYYNGGNVSFGWNLMAQNGKIRIVRIEIEPTVPIALSASWIQQAISQGYKVIATYHKYTVLGSDNVQDLTDAANWWKTNFATLAAAGSFTINLMNEWGDHNLSASAYAGAYNSAISIVRQVYSGTIIIDCPGWGQETDVAAAAVKGSAGTKIQDTNIFLSVHVYPNGWNQAKNHNLQTADLDDLASAGRGCIIGEFGNAPAGPVDWAAVVSYAKSKNWAILGWSWNGDGGTMNMVTPAWDSTANATSYSPSAYFTTIYSLL